MDTPKRLLPQHLNKFSPTATTHEHRTELFDYVNIVMRGKLIILFSFLVVVGITLAYTWTRPWVYESKAKMLISSEKGQGASAFFMGMMGTEERNIKNEIEVMRSKPLLLATARALYDARYISQSDRTVIPILTFDDVKQEYQPKTLEDTLDAVAGRLNEKLQLSSIRDADVVEVRIRTNNADEAALIVNTFVSTYQSDNENSNRSNARRVKDFLGGQVERTRDTLGKAEGDLQSYMSANKAVQMDEQSRNIIQKMSDFDSKYNEAKIMAQTVGKTLDEYRRQLKDVEPEFSDNLAASANPYIESLQNEIARLEVRRDLIITKNESYASKVAYDNAMGQLDQQINDLKGKLRQKTEDLRRSKLGSVSVPQTGGSMSGTVNPTAALNSLKQKIFDLQIQKQAEDSKVTALATARNSAESDFRRIPEQVIDLARLERTSSSLGKLHDLLAEKLNEATIAEQSVFGNVRVFEPAVAEFRPVSPNRMVNIAIGCVIGLAVGIALVIIRSFMDSTVRTPDELENRGFTVLATIPTIPRDVTVGDIRHTLNGDNQQFFAGLQQDVKITSHLISHVNPKSPIAENYRSVRTAIQFAHVDTHVQTVMVASSVPQEGKSTTSVNIATTLAQAGNKTLWIDCDLRRPVGHNVFHTEKEPGIVNVLVGSKTIEEAARPSGIPNLDVMTSGPIPPNPSELLGSQRMKDLLDELKKRYDNIIIDTPPVVAVTDAVILATLVDAYILVARANTTHMEIVTKSRESIERVGGRMLGIVLNDFDATQNYGSYYKYYRYYKYYNYYGEDAEMQGVKKPRVVNRKKVKA
ncbi:MAG: polysaccharide biosynthesis tyrosine autokinase [Candidatus Kapabacteria bacterium]|nr:polysaccharide biosynthesis tyrosine autokinase [Candidatus Kapabacteria bacterium]